MIFAALAALCCLPIASTKSPSGSKIDPEVSQSIACTHAHKRPTHEIEVDTMIHQIILPRFHIRRRRKIYPISLAGRLDLPPRARQAYQIGMEFLQVFLRHRRRISCRVASYEDRSHDVAAGFFDEVDHLGHLVEFFGADVGTVCKSKIDLQL